VSGFTRALAIVLESEGGFVHHAADRGGPTNCGITQRTYDAWRADGGQPPRPVQDIQSDEIQAIYHRNYWVAGKCDALPWPASLVHFDGWVNHKPIDAARVLQRALSVRADGIIGPITLGAADKAVPAELCNRMLWERLHLYDRIVDYDRSQSAFFRGWVKRILKLRGHV